MDITILIENPCLSPVRLNPFRLKKFLPNFHPALICLLVTNVEPSLVVALTLTV